MRYFDSGGFIIDFSEVASIKLKGVCSSGKDVYTVIFAGGVKEDFRAEGLLRDFTKYINREESWGIPESAPTV